MQTTLTIEANLVGFRCLDLEHPVARNVWIIDFRWNLAYGAGVGVGLGGRRCDGELALALIC